jgi:predicted RNase H-like HicB family nuclease
MAHGDDQEAALRNIKDVMQFWIERLPRSGTGKDTLKQQASPLAMRPVSKGPSERT